MNISRIYKSLSDSQRYNFWIAATNIFLCMFTFWLGITIQFMVVDKTVDYQSKLTYKEYEKVITPLYNNLLRAEISITKNILDQQIVNSVKKSKKKNNSVKKSEEDKLTIAEKIDFINHIHEFSSDYKKIMSNVDTLVNSARLLTYTLPKNKRSEIYKHIKSICVYRIYLDLLMNNNISADSIEYKISEYYTSDEYIQNTRIPVFYVEDSGIKKLAKTIKEAKEEYNKFSNELNITLADGLGYYIFRDMMCLDILKVCVIYDKELRYSQESTLQDRWNNLSLFCRSFLVLVCTVIIGTFFCIWFLSKLGLPSNPNRDYTAEEYRNIKKERDNLFNNMIQSNTNTKIQNDKINELESKIKSLRDYNNKLKSEIKSLQDLNFEYYKEIHKAQK